MSSDLESAPTADLHVDPPADDALMLPALLATCVAVLLLGLKSLLLLAGAIVLHSDLASPVRALAAALVGAVLVLLTWHFRHLGRVRATWACAGAAVVVSVLAMI